ncbi:hypothetical protein PVL29_003770 [Vitis rotundifolia]|uniref:ABC transporter domain-containing protein n=1 Tax=Vitis rotundifolia TaxID=103349 RepID=A0AA39AGG8_VITRO|nr:hypothetical protein PVL29_003770 [Vitis rotundifolia]
MPSNQTEPLASPSHFEIEYDSASMQSHNPKTRKPREVVGSDGEDGGVFLTWEDLWVTVSNGKSGSRSILQGLSGYARPGEVLAIMGPSGCGKSTLLDALAGDFFLSFFFLKIHVRCGMHKMLEGSIHYFRTGISNISLITDHSNFNSMQFFSSNERVDIIIKEMGLQDAINTRIGGWGVKGISGGQKRRVSICIEILTHPKLLFLNEPTSGLDSVASYYVMSKIARLDGQHGRTTITSIHQPSSEVFALFDNLCLVYSGRTVFFGPAHAADDFFSSNGFPYPTHQNPSDHFLKTINKDFEEDIEPGFGGKKSKEEVIERNFRLYISTTLLFQVQTQVSKIYKQDGGALKKRSHASFLNQCLVLTRRSFVNMYRDLGYYWLRLAIYVALTVALGTIFHNVGYSNSFIKDRGSMLMYVASFLTFMSTGGFPSFVEDMKVFRRERLNGHYGSSSFVVGNTLSSVPYLLVISLIPGAIAYFLTGLQKEYAHFIFYALVLFTCMMLVESLMMIVASVVPNFLMGIITGADIQGLLILGGGFFRLPNDLPNVFWRYPLYYISFNRYAYQGLYKNEFLGLTFPSNIDGGPHVITGEKSFERDMANGNGLF